MGWVVASRPGHFIPGIRIPDIHWIGGWVGPRPGVDAVTKGKNPINALAGNWTPAVQPVVYSVYWISYRGSIWQKILKINVLLRTQQPVLAVMLHLFGQCLSWHWGGGMDNNIVTADEWMSEWMNGGHQFYCVHKHNPCEEWMLTKRFFPVLVSGDSELASPYHRVARYLLLLFTVTVERLLYHFSSCDADTMRTASRKAVSF
jgi:hypothetical protein